MNDDEDKLTELLFKGILSMAALEGSGFISNSKSQLAKVLFSMTPSGKTAFRDSYLFGIKKLIEIYGLIVKLGFSDAWNFVHICLTDGEDTSSNSSILEVYEVQKLLGAIL